jgi:hypothetical protein
MAARQTVGPLSARLWVRFRSSQTFAVVCSCPAAHTALVWDRQCYVRQGAGHVSTCVAAMSGLAADRAGAAHALPSSSLLL